MERESVSSALKVPPPLKVPTQEQKFLEPCSTEKELKLNTGSFCQNTAPEMVPEPLNFNTHILSLHQRYKFNTIHNHKNKKQAKFRHCP